MESDEWDMEGRDATQSPQQLTGINSHELHCTLVHYITQSSHIFQANELSAWADFYDVHSELEHSQLKQHYDSETLRDEFTHRVLPVVYTYEWPELVQLSLQLLDLHPFYVRTPLGYELLPANERPLSCRQPKVNKDFRIVSPANAKNMFTNKLPTNTLNKFALDSAAVVLGDDHHTLAVPEYALHFETEVSPLTSSMLSAIFASDLELASSVVLEPNQVQLRLNEAKRRFEESGCMLPHVASHQQFLQKLRKIVETRHVMENIVNSEHD